MDDYTPPAIGTMMSIEHTSDSADDVRDFYSAVLGWKSSPVQMDGYDDYMMQAPGGEWVAGICHKSGPNSNQPPGWIPCFRVTDLDASIAEVESRGGKLADEIREFGPGQRYVVIADPQGLYISMMEMPDSAAE